MRVRNCADSTSSKRLTWARRSLLDLPYHTYYTHQEGVVGRHNIYLSDELSAAVQRADIALSAVCQKALEQEVRKVQAMQEAGSNLHQIATRLRSTRDEQQERDYQSGFELGTRWAKTQATEAELTWAAETASQNWYWLRFPDDHSLPEFLNAESTNFVGNADYECDPWMSGVLAGAGGGAARIPLAGQGCWGARDETGGRALRDL
jgi:post-segregation antitoxin (ccd killing protein)